MTLITPNAPVDEPLPPLKAGVEAIEIEHEGKPMILLRDQEGLSDRPLAVSLPAFFLAMLLNGQTTVSDLQSQFGKSTGSIVSPEEIRQMVAELDKAELLETPALKAKRYQTLEAFRTSAVRKAMHAGGAYPTNPMDLATLLGGFFRDPKGPGKEVPSTPAGAPVLGLVAPHIDFGRGGPAYAWAYQALGSHPKPDVIVGLGVAHMSPNSPWVLSKKSYETPYGPLAASTALYDDFQSVLWYNGVADEAVHRMEHSLEFQALWLKYLWRDAAPAWLPVLCSSFEAYCSDRAPSAIPTMEQALVAFGEKLKARAAHGEKILILMGVDLAHVGPRFGDNMTLNAETETKIEKEDRASLEKALALDADGFYMSVVADDHWRKVCGLSALYTGLRLLKMLGAAPGTLLTYGQAPDPMGGIVSFASAVFKT